MIHMGTIFHLATAKCVIISFFAMNSFSSLAYHFDKRLINDIEGNEVYLCNQDIIDFQTLVIWTP